MRILMEPPFCNKIQPFSVSKNSHVFDKKSCSKFQHKIERATEMCKFLKGRVLKTIRLKSILNIPSQLIDSVKVIFLVRDPRAMAFSRFNAKNNSGSRTTEGYHWNRAKDFGKLKNICDEYTNFLKYRENFENSIVVRFEDVVSQPIQFAKKIYKFTGLAMQPEVKQYLEIVKSRMRGGLGDWKGKLSWTEVDKIQNGCRFALEKFGYREVGEESSYSDGEWLSNYSTVEKPGCSDCVY